MFLHQPQLFAELPHSLHKQMDEEEHLQTVQWVCFLLDLLEPLPTNKAMLEAILHWVQRVVHLWPQQVELVVVELIQAMYFQEVRRSVWQMLQAVVGVARLTLATLLLM
jgi:hypothetical protein